MNQPNADITGLVTKIHEAFRAIEYPGDDKIAPGGGFGGGFEEDAIADALRGKDWRDIDAKFLNNYCIASLVFLDFQAYRYFLPAFLTAAVKDYSTVPDIVENLVSSLLDPLTAQRLYSPELYKEKTPVDWYTFVCRMNPLTCRQVEAVADVLKYLSNCHAPDFCHNGPERALEGYWLERLKTQK